MKVIDKSALVAEIENLENTYKKCPTRSSYEEGLKNGRLIGYKDALHKIDTLEVKDPYEQCVQYDSIKAGIQAHAETYSFNIESELFQQLTKEQQKLWRKEIEQAVISGGEMGVEFARDMRYKENLEIKEVDLEKAIKDYMDIHCLHIKDGGRIVFENNDSPNFMCDFRDLAKHFFELGLRVSQPTTFVYGIEEALKENGIDLDSKEADMYREAIYKIYDRLKAQKGE